MKLFNLKLSSRSLLLFELNHLFLHLFDMFWISFGCFARKPYTGLDLWFSGWGSLHKTSILKTGHWPLLVRSNSILCLLVILASTVVMLSVFFLLLFGYFGLGCNILLQYGQLRLQIRLSTEWHWVLNCGFQSKFADSVSWKVLFCAATAPQH